jgi:hypothetical protein
VTSVVEDRRHPDVPLAIAAVTVVVLVVVVVIFSVRGTTNNETQASACRDEAARVHDAIAAYRERHPDQPTPTAEQLVAGGQLFVAPLRYEIAYVGDPPALQLRPLAGSGC